MPALDTKLIAFALGLLLGLGTAYNQPVFLALAAVVFVMSFVSKRRSNTTDTSSTNNAASAE